MAHLSKPFTPQQTGILQEIPPTIGGFQVTPEGLELNPHSFIVGAFNLVLTELFLSGYILPGFILVGLTIKSPRV